MEKKRPWRLALFILMLAIPCGGSVAQVNEQSYALAFETVTSTLRRCGVELCYRKIEAACATLNHYNALFRKLAFVVFCCVKKQLWTEYEPCEGLDYAMAEEDVDLWEKKIRAVEVEDFAKSQVSLMSFCLHYIRSNHESIQLGVMKRLEEAVNQVQTDISSSTSITARLEEKRSEVNGALQKIKDHTLATETKVRQFKLNQRKVRKTLKHVTKIIREQHIHGELKKFRAIDFFMGSQVYIAFLLLYLSMHFVLRNSIFERHKVHLYKTLFLAMLVSLALDTGRLDIGAKWLGMSHYKSRLVLKAIVLMSFLNSIRSTIGNTFELNRLRKLQEFKDDCEKIRYLRYRKN